MRAGLATRALAGTTTLATSAATLAAATSLCHVNLLSTAGANTPQHTRSCSVEMRDITSSSGGIAGCLAGGTGRIQSVPLATCPVSGLNPESGCRYLPQLPSHSLLNPLRSPVVPDGR